MSVAPPPTPHMALGLTTSLDLVKRRQCEEVQVWWRDGGLWAASDAWTHSRKPFTNVTSVKVLIHPARRQVARVDQQQLDWEQVQSKLNFLYLIVQKKPTRGGVCSHSGCTSNAVPRLTLILNPSRPHASLLGKPQRQQYVKLLVAIEEVWYD